MSMSKLYELLKHWVIASPWRSCGCHEKSTSRLCSEGRWCCSQRTRTLCFETEQFWPHRLMSPAYMLLLMRVKNILTRVLHACW